MPSEAGVVVIIELGSLFFFFGMVPLAFVLARLPALWRESRWHGLLLSAIVVITGLFATFLLAGLLVIGFVPVIK